MITVESEECKKIIGEAAILRGQRSFDEALKVLDDAIPKMENEAKIIALLEAIYAAKEAGYTEKMKSYAQEAAKIDSTIPSVRKILAVK